MFVLWSGLNSAGVAIHPKDPNVSWNLVTPWKYFVLQPGVFSLEVLGTYLILLFPPAANLAFHSKTNFHFLWCKRENLQWVCFQIEYKMQVHLVRLQHFLSGCAEQGQLGRVAECFSNRGGRKGLGRSIHSFIHNIFYVTLTQGQRLRQLKN